MRVTVANKDPHPNPLPPRGRGGSIALADALSAQLARWSADAGDAVEVTRAVAESAHALSLAAAVGHVCLPLDERAAALLRTSRIVGSVQSPGVRPLVLDDEARLYSHRAFDHERALAMRLVRAAAPIDAAPPATALEALDAAFETGSPQHQAAQIALTRRLAVISGGPGTGKTTTAKALLAVLRAAVRGARVALAAPTGKAAARLAQAVAHPSAGDSAGIHASTVHRLLGARADGRGFVHGPLQPLALDVLLVDEASMLDLTLARRLFDAVPPPARVLLLGDKDQLAAVEAGAVFAELARGVLPGTAVGFTRSHRFAAGSGIARLAAALNAGDGSTVQALLAAPPDESVGGADRPVAELHAAAIAGHAPYLAQVAAAPADAAAAHRAFARFRVLCALREGPLGVEAINRAVSGVARGGSRMHWPGQPLMVLRNEPALGLYNGDIAIVLEAAADGESLAAWFQRADSTLYALPVQRLPPHETAFASTVHKAQGSEFDEVLVLPGTAMNRVLTRELLYTAVTRAKSRVVLAGDSALLAEAAARATVRHGGLGARIAEAAAHKEASVAANA
jgi:exodeoxyribonuclease V alpha subunit